MSKRKYRADNVADTRGRPLTGIPHVVMDSQAYRYLSMDARSVLFELIRKFNGYNNGEIAIGYRELADRLNRKGMHFIAPAIAELIDHGLLEVMVGQSWKDKRVREYRLTFISTGKLGHRGAATNEYLHWHYDPSKPRKRSRRKSNFPAGHVETESTRAAGNTETVALNSVGRVETVVYGDSPYRPEQSAGGVAMLIDSHIPPPIPGGH